MNTPEIVEIETSRVSCAGEGGGEGGSLGHPRVFLTLGEKDFVECPYCDRRFVLKAGAQPDPHGH